MENVDKEYQAKAKGLLRAEMARRNLSYDELAEKLAGIGVEDTARNLSNKISRGGFSAGFMLQCLDALGVKSLSLSE
ncbi:MAG: hypothetical protein GXP04_15235 [Alphaproteobacteria bacterium]|nr:hypothetical protein [Alphaproteobacteria bacterium]